MKPSIKPSSRIAARANQKAMPPAEKGGESVHQLAEEDRELVRSKLIEFHGASYAGWFNTALERDKSILTLSAGGIGLLVTLATTKGLTSVPEVILYVTALVSFLASLTLILIIFNVNKKAIESTLSNQPEKDDKSLRILDRAALLTFGLGVLFSVVIGISAGIDSLIEKKSKELLELAARQERLKEQEMANDNQKRQDLNESFSNLKNLKPGDTLKKSFEGLPNLKPSQGSSQTSKPPQPAASSPNKK